LRRLYRFDVLFLFSRDGDLAAVDEFLSQRLTPQLKSEAGLGLGQGSARTRS
jgi:hypothetical protein